MKRTYVVTSIQEGMITVTPEDHYISSKEHSKSNIEVVNPDNFWIKEGSRVTIGLPQKQEAVSGVIALLTPIAAAFAGFFASKPAAVLLNKECTEIFKALAVSVCFLIASACVIAASRSAPTVVKLQIKEVL